MSPPPSYAAPPAPDPGPRRPRAGRGPAAGPAEHAISLLEPSQRAAVLADDPVVCVLAGAGAGKTRVLTLRVARRLEDRSAHPNHVLVCTFSRKAASELRDRLWRLGVGGDVRAGTFHRTALQLISRYRTEHGMPAPTVLSDRRALLLAVLEEIRDRPAPGASGPRGRRGADSLRGAPPGGRALRSGLSRVEAEIGWAKARLVSPQDYEAAARVARRRPGLGAARIGDIYAHYEAARRRRGVLDLDDLIWHAADLLEEDRSFAKAVRWWHRHLFVDETQDLNEAQYRLLRLMVGDEPDLFVVGDPNQSVYGWNGADPALLDRITDEFAGTRVLRLQQNHRSSPQVVRVAAAALGIQGPSAPISTRHGGPVPSLVCLPTDGDEARWVARQVWLAHRPGRRWSSIAVLSRTNAQLARIAAALGPEHVPCRAAGGDLAAASDLADDGATEPDGGEEGARTDVAGDNLAPSDAVVLSTFHRSKGLQWAAVFVTGLSDGLVPLVTARSAAARAEERRLLYVALTRAEDELTCTWATHGDGDDPEGATRRPSPWLAPMESVIEELRATTPADAANASEQLARIRAKLPSPPSSEPARMP